MKPKSTFATLVATVAVSLSPTLVAAQVPGGLANGLSRGASGSSQGAAAVDRAQAKVQQRVQAQVQQRVQAQVQERLQTQAQKRAAADAKRAAQIAERVARRAEARVDAAISRRPSRVELGTKAQAKSRPGVRVGQSRLRAEVQTGAAGQAQVNLPEGITEADVQIYDNIFGEFNPLRQPQGEQGEANVDQNSRRGGPKASRADKQTPAAERSQRNKTGLLDGNPGFPPGIAVATRQRRANIARLRDRAVATGDTELLTRADEMELRLDAFVQAHTELRVAAGNSTGSTSNTGSADSTSSTGTSSTGSAESTISTESAGSETLR